MKRTFFFGFGNLVLLLSLASICRAQTAGKYDFYRYREGYAFELNPLGQLLGRIDGHFELRLDPNFSRLFDFAYQRNVQDRKKNDSYPESAITVGAQERIYLIDNGAIQGQFCGVGLGLGLVDQSFFAIRLTLELGYKWIFQNSHFFIEPMFLLDSYVITNYSGARILPYLAIPIGYAW